MPVTLDRIQSWLNEWAPPETAEAWDNPGLLVRAGDASAPVTGAVCALDGDRVVGLILFSVNQNRLSQLAVHPDYRRRGIASQMIALMLEKLDRRRDIVVTTFREGDEKGRAARALYSRLGFRPGNLGYSMDYPVQDFILPAAGRAD